MNQGTFNITDNRKIESFHALREVHIKIIKVWHNIQLSPPDRSTHIYYNIICQIIQSPFPSLFPRCRNPSQPATISPISTKSAATFCEILRQIKCGFCRKFSLFKSHFSKMLDKNRPKKLEAKFAAIRIKSRAFLLLKDLTPMLKQHFLALFSQSRLLSHFPCRTRTGYPERCCCRRALPRCSSRAPAGR